MISQRSVRLLISLLDQVTIQGSDPNLEEVAASVAAARRELEGLLAQPEED